MTPQPNLNIALVFVESVVPGWIGFERIFMGSDEDIVMRRRLGGAGKWQGALHHIGKAYRPFISLLRAPRPAKNQLQALHAIPFRNQPMLRPHVVADGNVRKHPAAEWRGRVA